MHASNKHANTRSLMLIVRRALLGLVIALSAGTASAAIEERSFADPAMLERYQVLIAELRCLVCQNQNLADSNASLARDLRQKTADMLEQGLSDDEIRAFMSERYGDFVLYKPPFNAMNSVLWVGPFVLLLLVILLAVRRVANKRQGDDLTPDRLTTAEQRQRARELLEGTDEQTPTP